MRNMHILGYPKSSSLNHLGFCSKTTNESPQRRWFTEEQKPETNLTVHYVRLVIKK